MIHENIPDKVWEPWCQGKDRTLLILDSYFVQDDSNRRLQALGTMVDPLFKLSSILLFPILMRELREEMYNLQSYV